MIYTAFMTESSVLRSIVSTPAAPKQIYTTSTYPMWVTAALGRQLLSAEDAEHRQIDVNKII